MAETVVVKVGGSMIDSIDEVSKGVASLVSSGVKVVLVHGGGKVVDEYSRRLGVQPRYVVSPSGIRSRYTTKEELEVYVMVMRGIVAPTILSSLHKAGVRALSLSGLDSGIVTAERKDRIVIVNERGRRQVIPGGYTGRITRIDAGLILDVLGLVDTLLLSPIALGEDSTPLNVDGDQLAAELAASLHSKLIMVTDVEGVLVGGKPLKWLKVNEAKELAGAVGPGMNRKLLMAARAVEKGAGVAVIGSPPLQDLYEHRRGTLIHG